MKKTNRLIFKEDTHQYFYASREFISSTTLIKKYCQPFDSKLWSTYKAIKDVKEGLNVWDAYKAEAGGWENVVAYWSENPTNLDAVLDRKQYYLQLWGDQGREARIKGTIAHAEKELETKGQLSTRVSTNNGGQEIPLGIDEALLMEGEFTNNAIYAEALIWNEEFEIAGMVDKIIKRGKYIDIEDYKTNKKLSYEGFRGSTMKYPLRELSDCNISHYQMQLSLYGWMLEQRGYVISRLTIIHIPDAKTEIPISIEYRPDLVEKMLKHYAKRRIFK